MKMAKRFTETMKWNEDWYLDLSLADKLFWIYVCDNCDHAGIFKPNKRMFELLIGNEINVESFLDNVNLNKPRICVLANGRWFLTGFIEFQYGNKLNPNNRVHKSILKLLNENDISLNFPNNKISLTEPINSRRDVPESTQEVITYFLEKGSNKREAERFFYFYESQGWNVGKNPMKDWKMAASGWISRNKKDKPDPDYLGGQLNAMKN
tara:strand:- start:21610 stop:22236 length:627 start_codon:yes stop_codon:yes gene_type:complete